MALFDWGGGFAGAAPRVRPSPEKLPESAFPQQLPIADDGYEGVEFREGVFGFAFEMFRRGREICNVDEALVASEDQSLQCWRYY